MPKKKVVSIKEAQAAVNQSQDSYFGKLKSVTEAAGEQAVFITKAEAFACLQEVVDNTVDIMNAFNTLKEAHNKLSVQVGLHRYILDKFVPKPHLAAAVQEFKEAYEKEIAAQEEREAAQIEEVKKARKEFVN